MTSTRPAPRTDVENHRARKAFVFAVLRLVCLIASIPVAYLVGVDIYLLLVLALPCIFFLHLPEMYRTGVRAFATPSVEPTGPRQKDQS